MNRVITILIPVMFGLTAVAVDSSADAKAPTVRSNGKVAERSGPKPVEPKELVPEVPSPNKPPPPPPPPPPPGWGGCEKDRRGPICITMPPREDVEP